MDCRISRPALERRTTDTHRQFRNEFVVMRQGLETFQITRYSGTCPEPSGGQGDRRTKQLSLSTTAPLYPAVLRATKSNWRMSILREEGTSSRARQHREFCLKAVRLTRYTPLTERAGITSLGLINR